MNNDLRLQNFLGAIVFVICFVIACMFLYWAVEYYVYNNFDHNRYTISKLQVGNNDSLSVWKLDNRTGELQYCTKSYDRMDHFVCVRSVTIDAQPETPAADGLKIIPDTKPESSASPVPESSTSESPQAANTATDTKNSLAPVSAPATAPSPISPPVTPPAGNGASSNNNSGNDANFKPVYSDTGKH